MKGALVVADVGIRQDTEGRYCLNDLHRAAGGESRHKPGNWLQTQQTQELIAELSVAGIPATEKEQALKVYQGGTNQGTYVCKELVYAYAMWISPAFHLKVIRAYDSMVTSPPPIDPMQALNDPATMRGLLLSYSEKVIALENKNAELTPKAEALDLLVTAEGLFNLTVSAKLLQMRRKDLIAWLFSGGYIYRRTGGRWVAHSEKMRQGLLEHKMYVFKDDDGLDRAEPQVFLTAKGLRKLALIFGKSLDLSASGLIGETDANNQGGVSHG